MTFFSEQPDPAVVSLLKRSGVNFKLDQQAKARLLVAIAQADLKRHQPERMHHGLIFKFGLGLAAVVLIVSGTLAAASTSQPGDKLFPVNKLREQFILSLPLSAQAKAKVRTQIVAERFRALDSFPGQTTKDDPTLKQRRLATIKESEESLNNAVDAITTTQKNLEASGNLQEAQDLDDVLGNLAQMATQRESAIQALADQSTDGDQEEINMQLDQFRSARHKAERQDSARDE